MLKTIEIPQFENESLLDFSKPEVNEQIGQALRGMRKNLGKRYPLLISGRDRVTQRIVPRENPSNIREIVGNVCAAGKRDVDEVIERITVSREVREWARASCEERAVCLREAAKFLRFRRMHFMALMMLEVGKIREEADAEICEAIDFLEYYAAYAPFLESLNSETLMSPQGEKNTGRYVPIGIGVSIQPWNFPLAISCGPTAAGLVMGNPIIYKPAGPSSIIGWHLAKVFYDAGIPKDVFHFLPGSGAEIGNYLLNHPAVKVIAFTGSKKVRRGIQEAVFKFNNETIDSLPPRERSEKRTAALESGGKGAIIIDSDTDPDEAVVGITDSSFSFQGQKCSAGTRIIIVDAPGARYSLFARIVERLANRIMSIEIGSPENPKNKMGPMISKKAAEDVREYMELAPKEGKVLAEGMLPQELVSREGGSIGYFLPPMLVGGLSLDSRIAQEEIFGPVLAVFKAESFEEALYVANYTEFGLTGGVFSRNPRHIEQVRREFRVGNLYINKKITGAVVGRQPFGGFKMSGNSTKAGGWDYLLNFVDRVNVSENTMRRGMPLE